MSAQDQLFQLFTKFKELHKNSQEEFLPTLENAMRWQWHVKEAEKRQVFEPAKIEVSEEAILEANERRFTDFSQMPTYMQEQFYLIASFFPGRQVYATGSRVNGEYIDEWSGPAVEAMREKLGKKKTRQSDYDVHFKLEPGEEVAAMRGILPPFADFLSSPSPEGKIEIPMWDFQLLPKDEHANVLRLYAEQKWGALMQIHNKYRLSHHQYCCQDGPVKRWFRWAIDQKIITADEQEGDQSQA